MARQTNELKKLNKEQLQDRLKELRKELIKMNAQISTGTPPENPGKVRQVKKTIARIYTILHNNSTSNKEEENKQ